MTMTEYFKGIGDVTNRSGSVSFARRPIFRSIRAWEDVAHKGGVGQKKSAMFLQDYNDILRCFWHFWTGVALDFIPTTSKCYQIHEISLENP